MPALQLRGLALRVVTTGLVLAFRQGGIVDDGVEARQRARVQQEQQQQAPSAAWVTGDMHVCRVFLYHNCVFVSIVLVFLLKWFFLQQAQSGVLCATKDFHTDQPPGVVLQGLTRHIAWQLRCNFSETCKQAKPTKRLRCPSTRLRRLFKCTVCAGVRKAFAQHCMVT